MLNKKLKELYKFYLLKALAIIETKKKIKDKLKTNLN